MTDTRGPRRTQSARTDRLLAAEHRSVVVVLSGGVLLYAMNLYFTAALLPSVVGDIGGQDLYAWVATAFLLAAVNASLLVSRALGRWGQRGAYAVAFVLFTAGGIVSAVTPSMEVMVVGRLVQGAGGGLLAGLGYAVIRTTLPQSLWVRGTALISGMWGVGALIGPSLGGLFAEVDAWRWAFALIAVAGLGLTGLALRSLPKKSGGVSGGAGFPFGSLALLTASAAAFSLGSLTGRGWGTAATLGAGVVLLVGFLAVDARARASVMPRMAFEPGSYLKWVYLTVAALCGGVIAETYLPLFGQGLAGLTPAVAGFFGAAISLGWVVAQMVSVRFSREGARLAIRIAPVIQAGALIGFGLLVSADATAARVAVWAVLLVVSGVAIGLSFPHLSVAAMSSSSDESEAAKASAALSTTQLIAYTISSALTGVFVAMGDTLLASARWMAFGLAALTALGLITTTMLARTRRSTSGAAPAP